MRSTDTEKERENNTANIKCWQFGNLGKECIGVLCAILATSLMVSHYFKIIRQMFHGFSRSWIPTSNPGKRMIRLCNNNPLVWISQRPHLPPEAVLTEAKAPGPRRKRPNQNPSWARLWGLAVQQDLQVRNSPCLWPLDFFQLRQFIWQGIKKI